MLEEALFKHEARCLFKFYIMRFIAGFIMMGLVVFLVEYDKDEADCNILFIRIINL